MYNIFCIQYFSVFDVCSYFESPCSSGSCYNDANTVNGYSCDCSDTGYTGSHCEGKVKSHFKWYDTSKNTLYRAVQHVKPVIDDEGLTVDPTF